MWRSLGSVRRKEGPCGVAVARVCATQGGAVCEDQGGGVCETGCRWRQGARRTEPVRNENLRDFAPPLEARAVHGRVPVLLSDRHVGACLDKRLHCEVFALQRRGHQRCLAATAPLVQAGATLERLPHARRVVLRNCGLEIRLARGCDGDGDAEPEVLRVPHEPYLRCVAHRDGRPRLHRVCV